MLSGIRSGNRVQRAEWPAGEKPRNKSLIFLALRSAEAKESVRASQPRKLRWSKGSRNGEDQPFDLTGRPRLDLRPSFLALATVLFGRQRFHFFSSCINLAGLGKMHIVHCLPLAPTFCATSSQPSSSFMPIIRSLGSICTPRHPRIDLRGGKASPLLTKALDASTVFASRTILLYTPHRSVARSPVRLGAIED